jgi:hypothetical protein
VVWPATAVAMANAAAVCPEGMEPAPLKGRNRRPLDAAYGRSRPIEYLRPLVMPTASATAAEALSIVPSSTPFPMIAPAR